MKYIVIHVYIHTMSCKNTIKKQIIPRNKSTVECARSVHAKLPKLPKTTKPYLGIT